ncbi:MAG: kelch repeat-containing protein [Pirellulaceae bacterium]
MLTRILCFTAVVAACLSLPQTSQAHFLWLVRTDASTGDQVHVYFAEAAEADDPDLLDRVQDPTVWRLAPGKAARKLDLAKGDDSLAAALDAETGDDAVFVLSHTYGVIDRGGQTFLLCYCAKTGPQLGSKAWSKVGSGKLADLDVMPGEKDGKITATVLWRGKPVEGAEVTCSGPGAVGEAVTNAKGEVTFDRGKAGLYSIRARRIEEKSGDLDGEKYGSVRHYATLALHVPADNKKADKKQAEKASKTKAAKAATSQKPRPKTAQSEKSSYPELPKDVTSFGGAVLGDALYIYGGHQGDAHSYSHDEQGDVLQRLDLAKPKAWETLAKGPHLQGLAMVAHGGKLYRVGGFTAKNAAGEEHDLWSQDSVACFDPADGKWRDLPSLPEPRSSHDAAILGDKLYVAGGWALRGEDDSKWHDTAWVMDLAADKPTWKALPKPPFQRRALALAAHDGKLYVIGGMQPKGGPSTRVDVFDPQTGGWSEGPSLPGEPIEGFGSSAFATAGKLYVSTIRGNLQRLSDDGSKWQLVRELETARFFHRMLPIAEGKFVLVGGANMSIGKFGHLDVVEVK